MKFESVDMNEVLDYLKDRLNETEFEAVKEKLQADSGPKLWELTFRFVDNEIPQMSCLVMANTALEAHDTITEVWGPPAPIEEWSSIEKHYFQVLV